MGRARVRQFMCETCKRKTRHNVKKECINCVTNKSKGG